MKSEKLYKSNLILDLSKFDYFKLSSSKYYKIVYAIKSIDVESLDYISIIYNSNIVSKEYLVILFKNIKTIKIIFHDLNNQSIKNSIIQINKKLPLKNIISIFFLNKNYFDNKIPNFKFLKFNIEEILSDKNKIVLNNKPKFLDNKLIFFRYKDNNFSSYLVSLDINNNYKDVFLLEDNFFDQILLESNNRKILQKKEYLKINSFTFIKTLSENMSFIFGILFYFTLRFVILFYKNKNKNKNHFNNNLTFSEILKKNISLLRWGDGESSLLFGRSIYFQRSSIKLQYKLIKLILNHKKKINRFSILFPSFSKKKIWNLTNQLGYFVHNINFSPFYFRQNPNEAISIINSNLDLFSNIIYVGNESPLKVIKHDFLFHFKTNSANSFDQEEKILSCLSDFIEFLENNNKSKKRVLILFGCGPLSKVLIEELTSRYPFHQYIDTGHLISILKI